MGRAAAVLVAILGQKERKKRAGTPGFDRGDVRKLVMTGLEEEDEKDQCREDQYGQK